VPALLCESRSTAGWDYIFDKDGESLSQLPFVEQFYSGIGILPVIVLCDVHGD
jgi:hypothetical protein